VKPILMAAAAALVIGVGQASSAANGSGKAQPHHAVSPMTADAFVKTASIANLYDIQAGQIAEQRAQSPDVKAFAQMIVKDHTKIADEMSAILNSADVKTKPAGNLDARHTALIQKLKGASASNFDEVFLRQQLDAHVEALKLMNKYAAHGDNAVLRTLAARYAPILRRHLDDVRRIGGAKVE
jgi:putative membrane protein